MKRKIIIIFFLLIPAIRCTSLHAQDSLMARQELYNGRIWINRFLMVKGDQFLFSRSFLPGTVTVLGSTFPVSLRYDIHEDEIQLIAGHFGFMQVNKELVDSFTILFSKREYHFISVRNDTLPEPVYLNVLYNGNLTLFAQYRKKIDKASSTGEGARFYQENRLYLVKSGVYYQVAGKTDLISFMGDQAESIKTWMRKNHVRVSAKDPQSFIPVIRHYDSLIRTQ